MGIGFVSLLLFRLSREDHSSLLLGKFCKVEVREDQILVILFSSGWLVELVGSALAVRLFMVWVMRVPRGDFWNSFKVAVIFTLLMKALILEKVLSVVVVAGGAVGTTGLMVELTFSVDLTVALVVDSWPVTSAMARKRTKAVTKWPDMFTAKAHGCFCCQQAQMQKLFDQKLTFFDLTCNSKVKPDLKVVIQL